MGKQALARGGRCCVDSAGPFADSGPDKQLLQPLGRWQTLSGGLSRVYAASSGSCPVLPLKFLCIQGVTGSSPGLIESPHTVPELPTLLLLPSAPRHSNSLVPGQGHEFPMVWLVPSPPQLSVLASFIRSPYWLHSCLRTLALAVGPSL